MVKQYKHSVSLDTEKCKGCTTCLKRCPTEAIRIRDGHAIIKSERCIDCGECIKVCPYKAKKATHDDLSCISDYKYKVALPAPSLYGQFNNMDDIGHILRGLRIMGFDDVFEVACAAELVTAYTTAVHQAKRHKETGNKLRLPHDNANDQHELSVFVR